MSVSFTKYIPAAYCLLVSTDWLRLVGRDVAHISMKAITITAGDLLVTRTARDDHDVASSLICIHYTITTQNKC